MKHKPIVRAGIVGVTLALSLIAPAGGTSLPQLSSKSGAVFAREIVRDADKNPIFVEYDASGNEVATGKTFVDTDNAEYRVIAGKRYRALVAQYQSLKQSYTEKGLAPPVLLDKASYLEATTTFTTLNNETIEKRALREDTLTVVLAPEEARHSTDSDHLLLLQLPIDPRNPIQDNTNSVLLNQDDGRIVYESPHNIGYRVGFYGQGTTVSDSERRTYKDEIFGPLKGVQVGLVSFDRFTQTDEAGKYSIEYYLPPCPGFSYEMNSLVAIYLNFKRFDPQGSPTRPYTLYRWGKETCYGYVAVNYNGFTLDPEFVSGSSASVTKYLDFPVDIMVLNGRAVLTNGDVLANGEVLTNDKAGTIPLGQTRFDGTRATLKRIAQQSYDLDGDGISETTALGKIVTDAAGNRSFVKAGEDESPQVQGVWLSSQSAAPTFDTTHTASTLPDITRQPDWSPDSESRALLSQISAADLSDTDLYVFRESDGSLLMERKGLDEDERYLGVDASQGKFAYTLRLVGSRGRLYGGDVDGDSSEFSQWQMTEGVIDDSPLYQREADHLRPGERVRIIAINRASGYLGSLSVPLQAASSSDSFDLSVNVEDIELLPPNLKVWAERQSRTELGLTREEVNRYLVGSEGAGMSRDQFIVVYSEWLDPYGRALPEELADYGYTARLARIVSENTLGAIDKIDSIAIKPGKQMALIRLPESGVAPAGQALDKEKPYFAGNEHFYVQVSGKPRDADFSSGGQGGILSHRPTRFVPVLAPVFDEATTNLAIQTWNRLKASQPDLKRPEPIYQWRYRPEYQFSVYDLRMREINRQDVLGQTQNLLTLEQPVITSSDQAIQILYDLTGPTADGNPLHTLDAYSYGEDKELVLAVGDQEISATVGDDGNIVFDDPSQLAALSAEDHVAIRLYANNDAANILWQWSSQPKLFEQVTRHLFVKQDVDILNGGVCSIGSSFKFYLSEEATVSLRFTPQKNSGGKEYVLLDNTTLQPGSYTFPVSSTELETGEYDVFLSGIQISNGYRETEQASALSELTTQDRLPVGHMIVKGVDLFDGHLTRSSQDFSMAGRGYPLEFSRSYGSNAEGKPGVLGVGWSHNWDVHIFHCCGEYVVVGAEGGGIRFADDGQGGFTPKKGYHGTLKRNGADFDFYAKGGNHYHFTKEQGETRWRLVYVTDPNGNTTSLSYETLVNTRYLSKVVDSSGRELNFSYTQRRFPRSHFAGRFTVLDKLTGPDGISLEFSYDDFGNLITVSRDAGARVEHYTYNTADQEAPLQTRHNLIGYTDPNGEQTTYTYNAKTISIEDNAGIRVEMPYRAIVRIEEPTGATTRFTYSDTFPSDSTRVEDPNSHTTTYALNRYGSAVQITDPVGTTRMEWAEDDVVMTSRTDANGVATTYDYDGNGNLLSEITGDYTRSYTYASIPDKPWIKNRRATATDRNGHTTTRTYDGNGNLVKVTDAEGGVTTYTYNSKGDRISNKDANGHTTTFAYDAYGNLASEKDPLGNTVTAQWDARSRKIKTADANGNTTAFAYDTLDRLTSQTNALGDVHSFSYDALGNKLSETDEAGRATTWRYDGLSRVVGQTDPLGQQRSFSYDGNGNKLSESDWQGNTTRFSYDAGNRLKKRTEPLGRVTQYSYDALGNLTAQTDANGHTTAYAYDILGRRIKTTDALGGVSQSRYDGENLIAATDANGHVTRYVYDSLNRRIETVDPLDGSTRVAYDKIGNKIAVTDANGHQQQFAYDAANRLTRQTNAEGATTTYGYDASGNRLSVTDALNRLTQYAYDPLNRKVQATDPAGYRTAYAYDEVGNLIGETWANGNEVTHTYDALNHLSASKDSLGTRLSYSYDANGNRTGEQDANGNAASHRYDALNRLVQSELPASRTVGYRYDTLGNKTAETDPNGNTTHYDYDGLNRLVTLTDPLGNTQNYRYDALGNKTGETDARGNTTTYVYDALNRLITVTDPLAQTLSYQYDAVGNKVGETDKRGTESLYTYDDENRLLTSSKDGTLLETLGYDDVGNIATREDANGHTTQYVYDARNLLSTQTSAEGLVTRHSYDAMGDTLATTDPAGRTHTWSYDQRRRTLSETNGAGEATTYAYDANGNRTARTRPGNNSWQYTFDAADRLSTVTDPLNGQTAYSYDGNGNLIGQTDANGNSTTISYDALNRKASTTYADGAGESYRYDANGNLTTLTDAKGQAITYTYDALNRQTQATYPDSSSDALQSIATAYDANSNPTGHTERYADGTARTTTQTYDTYDRLTQVTDGFGRTIAYAYDANGNRTGLTDPDGNPTAYAYDADNRLIQVTTAAGTTTYGYDGSGLITQIANPNATHTQQAHDGAGRLTTIQHSQGSSVLAAYAYTYDANGNRLSQSETQNGVTEQTSYDYDSADRLSSVTYPDKNVSYTYDANFNRTGEQATDAAGNTLTQLSYRYNSRNQLTNIDDGVDAAQSTTYQYDANGNQTVKSKNGVITTFLYEARDKLVSVQQDQTTLGQFRYDYAGMRIEKRGADGVLRYSYDGDSVLTQSDAGGNTVAKYEYGPDRLLSLNNATEGRRYYHHDALGSVVALSDSAGAAGAAYRYDAWGHYRETSGKSDNPFGFTGHERDGETGLYYFKARFYDPDTARFLTQDSYLGEGETPPSLHRYLYAYANPTVYWDPDGHCALVPAGPFPVASPCPPAAFGAENSLAFGTDGNKQAAAALDKILTNTWEGFKYVASGQVFSNEGGIAANGVVEDHPERVRPNFSDIELGAQHIRESDIEHLQSALDSAKRYQGTGLGLTYEREAARIARQYGIALEASPNAPTILTTPNNGSQSGTVLESPADSGVQIEPVQVGRPAEPVEQRAVPGYEGEQQSGYREEYPDHSGLVDNGPYLSVRDGQGRDHVTYQGVKAGKPYTGYASAPSSEGLSPEEIISRRYSGDFSNFGGVAPAPVYAGSDAEGKNTARGLEQRLHEHNVEKFGTENVANRQNPVGQRNPNREKYLDAADQVLQK